jgi:hypothetical protein
MPGTPHHLNGVTIILHKFHTEKEKNQVSDPQKNLCLKYTERKFRLSISKELLERDFVHMGTSALFTFNFLKILKPHIFYILKL